jgi:protein SCO1/2
MVALLGSLLFCVLATTLNAAAHEADMRGLILATLPAKGEIVVRHDALLGNPAGIATFRVLPASAVRRLKIGESIAATADTDETPWTLERVARTGSQSLTGEQPAATEDTSSVLRNVHHVAVGEFAPAADFTDQRGKPFQLGSLRGGMVVMAFVYSRCKDARACPLISAKFHTLQEKLRGQPVHLVEVTLDPAFDRPAVLARYGTAFGADPSRWTLATGDPNKVLDFAAQFDVTAFPDERVGLIHPERTVIIDQYGTIRELIDESSWSPDEIVATIDHDEHLASNPFERLNLWLSSAAVAVCGNSVAGFSGFTDLLTVVGIALFFGFLLFKLGRSIARGTT